MPTSGASRGYDDESSSLINETSSTRNGATFTAVVPGKIGRTYILQRQPDLSSSQWISVASSGPLVADGPLTLTDPNAIENKWFYRVAVERTSP